MSPSKRSFEVPVEGLDASAFRVPTDAPESDGTMAWDSTTMVVVFARAGGKRGVGWTYADASAGGLVKSRLEKAVQGRDALSVPLLWEAMRSELRNEVRPGHASMALAAADFALWDLKGRLLDLPLPSLLGMARERVPAYGSGGFTSYGKDRLREQLGGWARDGFRQVKMKVGRAPEKDLDRASAAREAIGGDVFLFVDANGAYRRKQALDLANGFADLGVTWLEEPVSSDDLEGLRLLRDRGPAGMEIAAGEYGWDLLYFRHMLEAGAVDVLQVDATRCGGLTTFLRAAALCEARNVPISAHCAPTLHLPACLCAGGLMRPMEYFHDHVRLEHMLLDGAATAHRGFLAPDLSRPGLGVDLKEADARRYQV